MSYSRQDGIGSEAISSAEGHEYLLVRCDYCLVDIHLGFMSIYVENILASRGLYHLGT